MRHAMESLNEPSYVFRSDGGGEIAGWSLCCPKQARDLFLYSVWLRGQWQAAPCVPRWSQTSGDPRVPVWHMSKVLPHQKCSSYPQVPVPSATVEMYCSLWFSNKCCELLGEFEITNVRALDTEISSLMTRLDSGIFQCLMCEYQSKIKQSLQYHIESKHVNSPGHICQICNKVCPTKNALCLHRSRNHKNHATLYWLLSTQLSHLSPL